MFSTNAPWSTSGYGQQIRELAPKIKEAGYDVSIVCFYGLDGGKIMLDGITMYPKVGDMWGEDAVINHSKEFKPDVVFTLQDIWVLNPQALKQYKNWIPICVDGNTLVTLADGSEIKIKEIVDKKMKVKVLGHDGKKIVQTDIKGWQKIPEKMDVYKLKTKSSEVLITGNNEVWVSSNGKKPVWKRTDNIIAGDVVYLTYDEPQNKKPDNKTHKTISNRSSLLSWIDRCRWNYNNNESNEKESKKRNKTHNSSINSSYQHGQKNDCLGTGKNWRKDEQSSKKQRKHIQSEFKKTNKISKNLLYCFNLWIQLFANIRTNNSLFNNKKRQRKTSNGVYSIKNKATKNKIQSTLYQRGNRYLGEGKNLKYEVVLAIEKVKSPKRRVYDISTKTGNFFANKILVHNCPIDHEPVPGAVFERLKMAYRVVTYSPYGQRELKDKGMNSTYIPHTVDTSLFKKIDKKAIRKKLNIPEDIFLFGMVAANKDNPPRKSFQEVMDAFHKFLKKHPKSGIYFHTLLRQDKGFPIEEYAKFLGIQDFVYHIPPYELLYKVPKEDMHKIYSAFDCLVAPSLNEGFGVPIIEAQACEVPVITNRFTAMRDLIDEGKTGFFSEVGYKRFSPLCSYVGVPSVDSIYKAMEKMYSANRDEMGKAGKEFVKQFDTKYVFEKHWLPFLEKLSVELCGEDDKLEVNENKASKQK
jgi:glycosyltransferase involved in cell wall biosynthesis